MGKQAEAKDDSMSKVLFLLVVVLLMVSMVSTYFILTMSSNAPVMPAQQGTGEIKLTIDNHNYGNAQPDVNKGVVKLTLLPAK